MRTVFIALAALSIAAPAFADDAVPQPQHVTVDAQPLPAASANNKIICHNQVHEGSVTQFRMCGTQQAWSRTRLETMQTLNEIEIRSYTSANRR